MVTMFFYYSGVLIGSGCRGIYLSGKLSLKEYSFNWLHESGLLSVQKRNRKLHWHNFYCSLDVMRVLNYSEELYLSL